jgi:hypothetical protein
MLLGLIRAFIKYVERLQALGYKILKRTNVNREEILLKYTNSLSLAVDSSCIKAHNDVD